MTTNLTRLGKSQLNGYDLIFLQQNENLVVEIRSGKASKRYTLGACEGLSSHSLTYNDLPQIFQTKVDRFLGKCEKITGNIDSHKSVSASKTAKVAQEEFDSDDDLSELEPLKELTVFSRAERIPVLAMTVACRDGNIKGSALIEMAHREVQNRFDNLTLEAELYIDKAPSDVAPPEVLGKTLLVEKAEDFFMSLGGWKGMMPSEEIKIFYFSSFTSANLPKRFTGVKMYGNGLLFEIRGNRLHIPNDFKIKTFNVTDTKVKKDEEWLPAKKTDLSYTQIKNAIRFLKMSYGISDSQIAALQLCALSYQGKKPSWFDKKVPKVEQRAVLQFLDFVNAVMFGIEASGLNAALIIGVMTLDLIRDEHFDYVTAFNANCDGGVYPYACFGDNNGTYKSREEILVHKKTHSDSYSMKSFRDDPALSPVGAKEAMLIKTWLQCNGLTNLNSVAFRTKRIKIAMEELVDYYFFPGQKKHYEIVKFRT